MTMTKTLYLLFFSGFCSFTLGSSDFHLITLSKTYTDAKTYCREEYTDLATVHNLTDMNILAALVPSSTARAWIGLETGGVWRWHWSWPDQKLDFFNWKGGEPPNTDQDACAAMDQHGEWFESDCKARRRFVCHGDGDASAHIFVTESKSWRDAQSHCRDLSSDLVSIHSAEENEAVHNVAVAQSVWIGLFKDPWKWSDGSTSSFRYWKPAQPNYLAGQDCVAGIFRNDGKWNDLKCTGKRRFVCRGAKKIIPTATAPTTLPQTFTTNQLTVNVTNFPNTTSDEVITTIHLTVVNATSHSNTTNGTTNAATTAGELTTPNTTDLTLSTELNNVTAELSTVPATQPTPNTTVQITTDGVSALTTLMGTSAQSTAHASTPKPTDNSQSVTTENLILIQENMTWIEAMSYCRRHHVDLVHITTEDVQEKVAETAKNATSAHVWLGLRYTCKSDFWFWIRSATGCYQNWAPGQGSERKYDCGVTGAIEATGRQQWVGLPETERLNFICSVCAG